MEIASGSGRGFCFLKDARDLVAGRRFDVLYLDPPFSARPYATYYHLPETIARGAEPRVKGEAGMPSPYSSPSDFTSRSHVQEAMQELLECADFGLLAFQYSDGGMVPPASLRRLLTRYGRVRSFRIPALGYQTRHQPRQTSHTLYVVQHG
ncbi:adenine specific DNA methyltransferase [mine drainage metagenome]|uniref:Adenine specific DNA methyltransferase n=1 Tax=mine drainage metagenome TaxID=410659 RepID=T0ZNI1_9ZZZZ